ncbi:MAG: hypothetical protein KFW07_03245 [Mycoplasmataceae bacterium]|nr:hypothetical protein [Mycoplasmataceae bacterium]
MNAKIKLLKMMSITTLVLPATLISCNSSVQTTISEIRIDRELLLKNFLNPGVETSNSYNTDLIKKFIEEFNASPSQYIVPANNLETRTINGKTITPFIYANNDHFSLTKKVEGVEPKIEFSASIPMDNIEQVVSTMTSVKFSFKLKSEYKPKVIIDKTETNNNIFSIQVRTAIPVKDSVDYKNEISWIRSFLFTDINGEISKSLNIQFLSIKIKNETYAKTPAVISSEIINREAFEKIFELIVPFPSGSSKWNYEVNATVVESSQTSINLNFSISNPLFPDLTPQEINGSFTIEGFASK